MFRASTLVPIVDIEAIVPGAGWRIAGRLSGYQVYRGGLLYAARLGDIARALDVERRALGTALVNQYLAGQSGVGRRPGPLTAAQARREIAALAED